MESGAKLEFDAGTLLLDRVNRSEVEAWFGRADWVWDARVLKWRADAHLYPRIRSLIVERGLPILDRVMEGRTLSGWVATQEGVLPELRPEQVAAVEAWSQTRNGVIVMPTGTGKTEVALSILKRSGKPALVVAPVRDLMYQWHRRILRGLGFDAGILGDQHRNLRSITVTTYASACIHATELGAMFDLLIFDECHHLSGPIRADAARCSIASERLGLTATLGSDPRALEPWIGPIVYELGLQDVRGKALADYDVVRIPVLLNPKERTRYKELSRTIADYVYERRQDDPSFEWKDLCSEASQGSEASRIMRLFREKVSIEDRADEKLRVLEDLFRLHFGEPMIIFTGSNAMAREVSMRFLIPCLLNHCGKSERIDYLEGLRDGVYPAIVANQVLDEGVDLPEVKVAVVLGGKSSTRQSKQRLGRILRKKGDRRAVLYEVVAAETKEVQRSRKRRNNDAYQGTRHRKVRKRPGSP